MLATQEFAVVREVIQHFKTKKAWALTSHTPRPEIPTYQLLALLPGQISVFPSESETLEIVTNHTQSKTNLAHLMGILAFIHAFIHSFIFLSFY